MQWGTMMFDLLGERYALSCFQMPVSGLNIIIDGIRCDAVSSMLYHDFAVMMTSGFPMNTAIM